MPRDGAFEHMQSDVLLPTEGEGGYSHVPVLGVGTGQNLRRKLPGDLVHISRRRVVETILEDLVSGVIAQFLRCFPGSRHVASTYEMAHDVAGDPNRSNVELEKNHCPIVVAKLFEGGRTRTQLVVPRVQGQGGVALAPGFLQHSSVAQ